MMRQHPSDVMTTPFVEHFMNPQVITNFGRNLSFSPQQVFTPESEEELLIILDECRGRKIRAIGRLFSWSKAPVANEVMLNLQHINQVQVEQRDDRLWVTVGAGCQIKRLLSELDRHSGATLPTVGLIAEQSIAGAVSTGTHGSGKHSLSHYIDEVRVATYDPATGKPVIRVNSDGPELRAARCSLGCLGVIVSVSFWCRPQYHVEEHFRRYNNLDEVLTGETEYPLQQFYLIPWLWQYFVQHRREVSANRSSLATLYRWYWSLVFDFTFHLMVALLARGLRSRRCVQFFFRQIVPWTVIQHWKVVDKSQDMLVMKHELFRHIEIEVLVKRSRLADSLAFVTELIKHFDGDKMAIGESTREQLNSLGLLRDLDERYGSYTHHYQITVRRVLPDDTLISMASGVEEPYYAISFISYARPTDRHGFLMFAESLCRTMVALFDGRPHWGKVCPLTASEASELYVELPKFREVCEAFDSSGVFQNEWVNRLLFEKEPARTVEKPA